MFRFAASSTPSTLTQTVIRLGAVAVACSALTWSLSGCGGGSRAKEYTPDSVVSFGDENSAMTPFESTALDPSGSNATKTVEGLIYTVNPVVFLSDLGAYSYTYCTNPTGTGLCVESDNENDPNFLISEVPPDFAGTDHRYYFESKNTDGTNILTMVSTGTGTQGGTSGVSLKRTSDIVYRCESSYLWNQMVAHNFGKGFQSKCSRETAAGAETYAAPGAKVSNLQTQVSDSMARGELRDGVLVTIMIGQNDIKDIYDQVQQSLMSDSTAQQLLASRGATAANIVKSVLNTGAKVVLALTPDLGQSPLAAATGENASLLTQYTRKFNDALKFGMGSTAAQDGRHFALVETDLFTNPITRSNAYVHGTAVCNMAGTFTRPDGTTVDSGDADYSDRVQYCTSKTLVTDGSITTYIWADNLRYAPAGHGLIGSTASTRVANQF